MTGWPADHWCYPTVIDLAAVGSATALIELVVGQTAVAAVRLSKVYV